MRTAHAHAHNFKMNVEVYVEKRHGNRLREVIKLTKSFPHLCVHRFLHLNIHRVWYIFGPRNVEPQSLDKNKKPYLICGLLKTLWVYTRRVALSYAKLANPTCQALNIVTDSTPPLCCATSQHTEAHWSYTSAKSIGQTDCKLSDKPMFQTSYLKLEDYHQVINDVLSVSNLNQTQVGYYSCYFCIHS